jgi:hypothetical protein
MPAQKSAPNVDCAHTIIITCIGIVKRRLSPGLKLNDKQFIIC